MPIAVMQNVGTILRHNSAAWQRIITDENDPEEVRTLPPAKDKGLEVVAALDKLGVGTSPVLETVEVEPTAEFVALSQNVLFDALTRLHPVTVAQLPVQFDDFQELIDRINELVSAIAVAQIRFK